MGEVPLYSGGSYFKVENLACLAQRLAQSSRLRELAQSSREPGTELEANTTPKIQSLAQSYLERRRAWKAMCSATNVAMKK